MPDNLAQAMALLDHAEEALHKIRTETPVDYMDTDEGLGTVTTAMRKIDADDLEQAMVLMDQASDAEREQFGPRFSEVNRMFSYLAGERTAGRLPQLKEAPWPPSEWVVEDNMRADAADAEAEPATNGYAEAE